MNLASRMLRTMRYWLKHNPALAWAAGLQTVLAIFALIAMPFDHRQVLGINPWIKPFKFDVSFLIMLGTLAAILSGLERFQRSRTWIATGFALSASAEDLLIALQSLRGVRSHFNYTTPFNTGLFITMGVFITLSSLVMAWALVLVMLDRTHWLPALKWGVILGLLTFLAGSAEGVVMIVHGGHTVGASDGGSGLPFINWSLHHGDLRIAHFFALHALQVFPWIGWFMSGTTLKNRTQIIFTTGVAIAYMAGVWWLFHQAMAGRAIPTL